MTDSLQDFAALIAILPAAIAALVRSDGRMGERTTMFWATLALAVIGPVVWVVVRSGEGWRTDVSTALWITVAATLASYAALAILTREGWRLAGVVMPYMAVFALIATIWDNADAGTHDTALGAWVVFHVLVSVVTYAVVTLAACAAFAGFMQERALKTKQPTAFTHQLPSMSDCDHLQVRLLAMGELVLGLGLITGVAASLSHDGILPLINHKSVFAVLSFIFIGALLWIHRRTGVRGRQAARGVLAAYLLLTLAYLGVKFVTDVVLG